ncbi:MAG: hypothetical protein K9H49_16955 [Bacteroidales bacterium]|nr:hypothetical protein [Bacteroidales bacterium]MCF8391000.1 hypothetical protein [Bacteroidales bacterium]
MKKTSLISVILFFSMLISAVTISCNRNPDGKTDYSSFLADLKRKTFNYFWEQVDIPSYGIPDRFPTKRFTSIAATGFGIPSYIIGIENNFISREDAATRVLKTLEWFWNSKQGDQNAEISGYKGFYYHFLTYNEGIRYKNVELSTIDTGLLMAGILTAQSYFTADNDMESSIRSLADSLFLRVEWDWAMNGQEWMSMGWKPETGFLKSQWDGYNEAMVLIIMAMGSPRHPIHDSAWNSWCKTYQWEEFYGQEHLNFSPLFGHQYSQMFIDFRGIQDDYMREKGIDYFENSRRATLSNRAYCIDNPSGFENYSDNIWGLTACDGPKGQTQIVHGDTIQMWTYKARGASALRIIDDGTIAPTAAGGSIPFAPEICIPALYSMKETYGELLYQEYGFKDAFNITYADQTTGEKAWFDKDYLGIDQGPILIQLENYETELIWNILKTNKYIIKGLQSAGFRGGWLDAI